MLALSLCHIPFHSEAHRKSNLKSYHQCASSKMKIIKHHGWNVLLDLKIIRIQSQCQKRSIIVAFLSVFVNNYNNKIHQMLVSTVKALTSTELRYI